MRILIADDEPVARQVLREHVEAIPSLEIAGEASTGKETLQRILDLDPDVVLLDQQMPELDGLAVVRSLRGALTPQIIFVTAYEKHALDAFEVGAVDYLLKPVRRERLERALEKARRQLKVAAAGTPKKIVGRCSLNSFTITSGEGFGRQRIVVAPFRSGNEKLLPSPYANGKRDDENKRSPGVTCSTSRQYVWFV